MSKTIEHEWEIHLPASTPEEILAALAARDRLFGQTITLEPEDDPEKSVEVWIGTTDVLADDTFHLVLYAELTGPEDYLLAARDALEDIVAEQVELGTVDAEQSEVLDERGSGDVEFRMVDEDDERPQLLVPEWLAPEEEIELPWSFRPYLKAGDAWPAEAVLDAHERVAVVPADGGFRLYALPVIEDDEEE